MQFGIEVVPFGPYSDPRPVVELAQAAEAAGWEAITLWDHVLFPYGAGDPWVTLAAVAATTQTDQALHRRLAAAALRPARAGAHAHRARPPEPGPRDPGRRRRRGLRLHAVRCGQHAQDSAPPCSTRAWRFWTDLLAGQPVTVHGAALHGRECATRARPGAATAHPHLDRRRQQAGLSPRRALGRLGHRHHRRAAEHHPDAGAGGRACRGHSRAPHGRRTRLPSRSPAPPRPDNHALPRAYADAGATWWFECLFASRGSHADMLARIKAGPPRVA